MRTVLTPTVPMFVAVTEWDEEKAIFRTESAPVLAWEYDDESRCFQPVALLQDSRNPKALVMHTTPSLAYALGNTAREAERRAREHLTDALRPAHAG